jgi:hypothetical protein
VAGIFNYPSPGGAPVFCNNLGKLGTLPSSARFKKDIKPMDQASDDLLQLKPVTFRYNATLDPAGLPQFGLVAEDVAKVNPALVIRDQAGKPLTVRYEAVNAMLLNEFLKEHRKVEALAAANTRQQSINVEQQKQLSDLTAALQKQAAQLNKVSLQLEANEAAPHLVTNH